MRSRQERTKKRHLGRWARWSIPLLAPLSLASSCDPPDPNLNPSIEVQEDRAPATASLRELTINGSGFTPNGGVRITYFLQFLGGGVTTVAGADITADGSGSFQFKHQTPMMCPADLGEAGRGSFTAALALDLTGNRLDSQDLHPGQESDCVNF